MSLLKIIGAVGVIIVVVYSCDIQANIDSSKLNIRWIKSYPEEKKEDVVLGFKWYLSFLGAHLHKGTFEESMNWEKPDRFSFDFSSVGFEPKSLEALQKIIRLIKDSDEYKINGAIDMGRLIALTLNNTYHYYQITQAENSFTQFESQYIFYQKPFAITASSVAKGNRIINVSKAGKYDEIAYVALEGRGNIDEGTFEPEEREVLTLMSNGQFRFALYDENGNLKASASKDLTAAGKPVKCLWCHEISLQPLYNINKEITGYMTPLEFTNQLNEYKVILDEYRSELNTDIDYSKLQDHTKMEWLYLGFYEPSSYRIASEWNMSIDEVKAKLAGIKTHNHSEFNHFEDSLYERRDIDKLGPHIPLQVPDDAREFSTNETNLLN